jgi:hypothetical protein
MVRGGLYRMPSKGKSCSSCAIIIIVVILLWLFWLAPDPVNDEGLTHQMHGKLTGQDAVSDSTLYGVGGTDLGIVMKHNGQFYFFFGDTFSSTTSMTGNWRSNTLAKSSDNDPSDGITIDSWVMNPTAVIAKELIGSLKVDNIEVTCIPTAALSLNGIIYVYYMSVRHWSVTGGVWTCNNASIAVSLDNGQSFTKMTNISWAGDSNFVLFGIAQDGDLDSDYIYLLSTPAGRFGSCYLSRVLKTQLLNQSSYEYCTGLTSLGDPVWGYETSSALAVFPSPVGEVSVMWNEYLQKWTAFYTDNIDYSIVVRTADNLWGEWSEPSVITDATEYPTLYGSFVHPDLVEGNGSTVYFIMSLYSQYNTYVMSVDLSGLAV